jgi:hypothetical protein
MASQSLSSQVNTVEKYLNLAHDLRARAELPMLSLERSQILALAAHFEKMADAILDERDRERKETAQSSRPTAQPAWHALIGLVPSANSATGIPKPAT